MAAVSRGGKDTAYPQLHKDQVDLVISSLMTTMRDRDLGTARAAHEGVVSYLIGFYTKRWGMPPALAARVAEIRR